MLDVVDLVCLGMAIDKHLRPPVEVGPVVIHNRAGNARSRHGILQAHVHGLLGRVGHRLQGNQFHVLMAQRLAHGKLAQPNAKNDQTFALADLDRMVDHPDPVLGDDLGTEQGRQADPQEPQSAGRPIGGGFVVPRRRAVERYHAGGATQGRTANGDQRHEPLHHVNGILLAARYVLLGRVER